MRLSRIYIEQPLITGEAIDVLTDKAHYIRNVLRLKKGHALLLFNGLEPVEYRAEIETLDKSSVRVNILERIEKDTDSYLHITLIQGMGKNEAVDLLVQKATELGVARILLFNAEHTQFPLKGNRSDKKMAHWRGIAESACEQCGRNRLPEIHCFTNLDNCIQALEPANRLRLDFDAAPLNELSVNPGLSDFQVLIGPEGGLSDKETVLSRNAGFAGCTMGPRVLRMETAALTISALLQHRFGDI